MGTKHQYKKMSGQAQQYKDFVNLSYVPQEDTISISNEMLVGSDELQIENNGEKIHSKEAIKKKPLKLQISDWFKSNFWISIITGIIGTVVVTFVITVVKHEVRIAVIEQRIEYIEKQLDSVEANAVEKDYFDLQLSTIKSELSNGSELSFVDIKWKIKELEDRVAAIDNYIQ